MTTRPEDPWAMVTESYVTSRDVTRISEEFVDIFSQGRELPADMGELTLQIPPQRYGIRFKSQLLASFVFSAHSQTVTTCQPAR